MADKTLQKRADSILSGKGKAKPQADSLLREAVAAPQRPLFSAFVDEHMDRAAELAEEFSQITQKEGLEAAMQAIEKAMAEEPIIGLVQYALKLFMVHNPEARASLKLKPLEVRQANMVVPSEPLTGEDGGGAPEAFALGAPVADASSSEKLVNYWREDPLINEHHEHWHLVYPTRPSPPVPGVKPAGGYSLGDRHGELFGYMHEQMLARYDTERLAAGIKRVQPYDNYPASDASFTAPIPQGYDPGNLMLWDGGEWYAFRPRPDNVSISDLTLKEPNGGMDWSTRIGAKISAQVGFINNLFQAGDNGSYTVAASPAVTADNLGNTLEANRNSVDYYGDSDPKNQTTYGNVHNDGHIHFMLYDNTLNYGVMSSTTAAVRDPIFFRWHKLINDIFDSHRQKLPAYDFSDAPLATIRKGSQAPGGSAVSIDIILSLESGLPDAIDGHKFGSTAYNTLVATAFADKNWDGDFTKGAAHLASGETVVTTDELPTEMLTRNINIEDENGNPETQLVGYLSHDDFYYFIRVENNLAEPQTVVARVFLAMEDEIDDRRMWIELDKFSYGLKPNEKAVLFRPSDQSSVVRKPALKPDDLTADDGASPAREAQPWCDCGWPYNVLLPRGTKDGMKFRLLVMLSNGDDLTMPDHPDCCTSISYCGLQDLSYPDKAPIGFPFDRPLGDSLETILGKYGNWASRTITIRCKNL